MRTLIIAVSIIAVGATIGTIVVGGRSFDGLVVEKPYETGLDWDKTQEQKARLGWTVSTNGNFLAGGNELLISVADGNGVKLRDAVVTVKVTRPSTVHYDKTYQTALQPDGRYRATIDLPFYGNWDVIMNVKRGKERADFTKSIFAERSK
jgi:nitrogen fixation protein FixH